ncbi:LbtU family siderophore porin [Legionella nagasakiensis]|uniref:LbtU family siderophore porin n=1 Tax=Legionella nagasakiensis TaxID=535290 RepID=UPI0013EF5EE0|nr:LbtU family siderophore porin [Legionella nagasakiensis]
MFKTAASFPLLVLRMTMYGSLLAGTTYAQPESLHFSYDGHLFFNATNSAMQGEKYLLNQQLSNIKLNSELQMTAEHKIKGLFIYNTVPTPVAPTYYVDQLYGEFNPGLSNWTAQAGKNWLAFGRYKNDLIYKPLTKALGQTNKSAFVIDYHSTHYASLSFFYPSSRIRSSSLPIYYNLDIGLHHTYVEAGASYLYSIADSQIFQYNKGFGGFLANPIHSHIPGVSGYINMNYQQFSTYLTYVTALHPFQINELSYNHQGAVPSAVSIQSAYAINIRNIPLKIIGFYDHSFQALSLKLPKRRIGIGLSGEFNRYITIQFQYGKDNGYASNRSSTGLNRPVINNASNVNTFALQAILNF